MNSIIKLFILLCLVWQHAFASGHLIPSEPNEWIDKSLQNAARENQTYWVAEFGGVEGWSTPSHICVSWNKEKDSYVLKSASYDENDDDMKIEVRKKELSKKLGESIRQLWFELLMTVRYPEDPRIGTDGSHYHFQAWVFGYGTMRGNLSWPRESDAAYKFILYAKELDKFSKSSVSEEAIYELTKSLLSKPTPNNTLKHDAKRSAN
jgi:hypothetical protein